MIIVIATLAAGTAVFSGVIAYMWAVAYESARHWRTSQSRVDIVSVHTFKPRNGRIPFRGQLVLHMACLQALRHKCPLILSVGRTIPGVLTEAQIYANEAARRYPLVTVSVGQDETARETLSEAREALRISKKRCCSTHLVVGLAPHLARIRIVWKLVNPALDTEVLFLPVPGAVRYWVWEACMLCLYIVAPPGSRAQGFLLDLVGRKG